MIITIYHILFDGALIAETGIKDKIESMIEDYIKQYTGERKSLYNELKELEEAFKDIYGPREKDTFKSYNDFVMKNYPELFDRLDRVGKKVFKGSIVHPFVFTNKDYGWHVIENSGASFSYRTNDAKGFVLLDVSRDRFTIKEVEIEIP